MFIVKHRFLRRRKKKRSIQGKEIHSGKGRELLGVAHLATFLELASSASSAFFEAAATRAKYWITFFVFSVLPAPDSPLWNNHHIIVLLLSLFGVVVAVGLLFFLEKGDNLKYKHILVSQCKSHHAC